MLFVDLLFLIWFVLFQKGKFFCDRFWAKFCGSRLVFWIKDVGLLFCLWGWVNHWISWFYRWVLLCGKWYDLIWWIFKPWSGVLIWSFRGTFCGSFLISSTLVPEKIIPFLWHFLGFESETCFIIFEYYF